MVHDKAFPAQENEQAPVAKAPAFPGERQKSFAQLWIVRPPGAIAHRHPVAAGDLARPPLAHLMRYLKMSDSLPLYGGRHHFFDKRSFSAALSSMASANNLFSLAQFAGLLINL